MKLKDILDLTHQLQKSVNIEDMTIAELKKYSTDITLILVGVLIAKDATKEEVLEFIE